jgi:hypothetical protein
VVAPREAVVNVLAERLSEPLRARLVECDCGVPGCSTVFIVMQVVGARDDLWLSFGVSFMGEDAAAEIVDRMLDDPCRDEGAYTLRQMVERGMALIGLTWEDYLSRTFTHQVLEAQVRAWAMIPSWMERLPAGKLWALRGVVFGRPLSRVPRALYAEAASYVPDQPEAYVDFSQDLRWGLEVLSRGQALIRVLKDVPVPEEIMLNMARWDDA